MPDDKPEIVVDPPDVPPTLRSTTIALSGAALALTGFGLIDLVLAFTADCLNALNLLLGLGQVALGLVLLWWILSWWLPRCRRGLVDYERQLHTYHAQLVEEGGKAAAPRPTGPAAPPPEGSGPA